MTHRRGPKLAIENPIEIPEMTTVQNLDTFFGPAQSGPVRFATIGDSRNSTDIAKNVAFVRPGPARFDLLL